MTVTRLDRFRVLRYLLWTRLVLCMESSRRAYLTGLVTGSVFTALTIALIVLIGERA